MQVYKITNKINNKLYIGITTTKLNNRISSYKSSTNSKKDSKHRIIMAMKKHGFNNFIFESIDTALNKKELCEKLSNAHKGYIMPQNQKDAIGKSNKDATSIERIDIKTGVVKVYSSCKEVEKDGYNRTVVWRAVVGERRTAYKYKWKIVN